VKIVPKKYVLIIAQGMDFVMMENAIVDLDLKVTKI